MYIDEGFQKLQTIRKINDERPILAQSKRKISKNG